jgi:hypothetical protein
MGHSITTMVPRQPYCNDCTTTSPLLLSKPSLSEITINLPLFSSMRRRVKFSPYPVCLCGFPVVPYSVAIAHAFSVCRRVCRSGLPISVSRIPHPPSTIAACATRALGQACAHASPYRSRCFSAWSQQLFNNSLNTIHKLFFVSSVGGFLQAIRTRWFALLSTRVPSINAWTGIKRPPGSRSFPLVGGFIPAASHSPILAAYPETVSGNFMPVLPCRFARRASTRKW